MLVSFHRKRSSSYVDRSPMRPKRRVNKGWTNRNHRMKAALKVSRGDGILGLPFGLAGARKETSIMGVDLLIVKVFISIYRSSENTI
jgi:hypothetical protein